MQRLVGMEKSMLASPDRDGVTRQLPIVAPPCTARRYSHLGRKSYASPLTCPMTGLGYDSVSLIFPRLTRLP